jgi:diguanylate cyclase (GGDEF)-like protein/PAS domain S-box-containing protein
VNRSQRDRRRRASETQDPSSRLETLLRYLPIAVFELDGEGRYLMCRGQVLERIGIGQDEAVGCSIFERHARRPAIVNAARAALAGVACSHTAEFGGRVFQITFVPKPRNGPGSAGLIGLAQDITELHNRTVELAESEARLKESEGLFRSLVTNMRDIIFCHGVRGQGPHGYDDLGAALYGADAQSIAGTVDEQGRARIGVWYDAVHPDDRPAYREAERRRKEELVPYTLEYRVTHPATGQLRWMREVAWVVEDPARRLTYFDSYIHDISEAKRAELALRESEERHRRLLEAAPVAILSLVAGACSYANPQAVRLLGGRSQAELLGRPLARMLHGADVARLVSDLRRIEGRGAQLPAREVSCTRQDGVPLDLEVSAVSTPAPTAAQGEVQVVLTDLTERKHAEMMRYLAEHDALTGLPNRRLLLEHLRRGIASVRRYGGGLALHLLDLDGFKRANDRLGHAGGDEVLRQTAARIRELIREEDLLARFGGDEFALVQGHVRDPQAMAALAQRVIEALSRPFVVGRQQIRLGVSIGIACRTDRDGTPEQLLEQADRALYRAKGEGRGRLRFFAADLDEVVEVRRQLELELARAPDQGELRLVYQPQLELSSARVVGVEALLRWHSPSRGLVGPDDFIPVAERSGLIAPIGAWVIDRACAQGRAWRDRGLVLPISVNVSAVQLRQPQFADEVAHSLARHDLHPDALCLELTESLLIDPDLDDVGGLLTRLSRMGLRIAIDDFGTGYSSLTNLKRLPVDTIKIDSSFIREVGRDGDSEAIINATVGLAHNLGKAVVAEGVETECQHSFLLAAGCDHAQGYRYGRPDAAERIGALARLAEAV